MRNAASYTYYAGGFSPSAGSDESFDYDKHGNITALQRSNIDNLPLDYTGNQLRKVTDSKGSQHAYNIKEYQDLANLPVEFYYDANGNMTTDLDREIVTIRYNVMNLPAASGRGIIEE